MQAATVAGRDRRSSGRRQRHPRGVRVEARHRARDGRRRGAEVLLIHDAVVVDQERHHAGFAVARRPGDQREAVGEVAAGQVAARAAAGRRPLRLEDPEPVAVIAVLDVAGVEQRSRGARRARRPASASTGRRACRDCSGIGARIRGRRRRCDPARRIRAARRVGVHRLDRRELVAADAPDANLLRPRRARRRPSRRRGGRSESAASSRRSAPAGPSPRCARRDDPATTRPGSRVRSSSDSGVERHQPAIVGTEHDANLVVVVAREAVDQRVDRGLRRGEGLLARSPVPSAASAATNSSAAPPRGHHARIDVRSKMAPMVYRRRAAAPPAAPEARCCIAPWLAVPRSIC